ncbi:hypothetical protein GCM10009825_18060 [Arthrobacter humicola]|uniref:Integral membrane protein n=1 Tax=Arthrobacter humicola TaxID=409291 RepID=A0ABN2YZF7_9MICC
MNVERPIGQPTTTETVDYPTAPHRGPANRQAVVPASPLRIATGVVALVLPVVGLPFAAALLFSKGLGPGSPFNGWMNFFLIVGSIGCVVTGIVIIAKQRRRGGATPWLVGSFALLVVIACLGMLASPRASFPGFILITVLVAIATLILAILVIVMDKAKR